MEGCFIPCVEPASGLSENELHSYLYPSLGKYSSCLVSLKL